MYSELLEEFYDKISHRFGDEAESLEFILGFTKAIEAHPERFILDAKTFVKERSIENNICPICFSELVANDDEEKLICNNCSSVFRFLI